MAATLYQRLFNHLNGYVNDSGVAVLTRPMDVEKPGEFDGPSITISPAHDVESACYYLVHAFGSIYQWSNDFDRAQKVFEQLRKAKTEAAIAAWRRFEETSSEYAAWVLQEIGHAEAVGSYTVFFRADIEAMTIFHRTGKEPRGPDFFADWKRRVESGEIRVEPFRPDRKAGGPAGARLVRLTWSPAPVHCCQSDGGGAGCADRPPPFWERCAHP